MSADQPQPNGSKKPGARSGAAATETSWYAEGLKFQCSECGDCCTGAPGFVWVNGEEIAGLAARLKLDVEEFQRRFVRSVGVRKTLVEFPNGDCVFFDGKSRKCTVYEDRPRQCRTWPFWDSNLKSEASWQETCEVCPGSGQGKLFSWEEIERQRKVIRV